MANEAFALSPISARAAQPSEEDYEAIREAFMETSRGRWFLTEYAKRNRNADTSMVLDAVARIEETLATQRQPPAPENNLPEVLAAIRSTLESAKAAASAALDSLALEANLAPIWKAARIIKEISWRWREIGADGRICDLIDSQVSAIEGAYDQLSSINARSALDVAFDLIERELEGLAETGLAETAPPEPAEAMVHQARPVPSSEAGGPVINASEVPAPVGTADAQNAAAQASPAAGRAEVSPELSAEAADAHDEAVLEMVAFEMAVPDPFDEEEPAEQAPAVAPAMQAGGAAPVKPETVAAIVVPPSVAEPKPCVAPVKAEARVAVERPNPNGASEPPSASSLPAQLKPVSEPSIGSTVIANGIVGRRSAANDPLAPIRRMSQAEKIAFFS